MDMKTAVFTIASRNYFSYVETLMESLEKTNPEWERFVAVADEVESLPLNSFRLVNLKDLQLPEVEKMKFKYTILEFNTAIKPFVFNHLFSEYGYDRVLYFDPDIQVFDRLNELEEKFDEGNTIILTPHFTGLWSDSKKPNEVDILLSGTYNLGFLGLAKSKESQELLKWWGEKLAKQCVADIAHGIFVDQKWMDLVPGFFPNVFILRHEGYNVAYWNLSHRIAEKKNGRYYFNGQPLKFFHFSGINPFDISQVSKHQNRYTIDEVGAAKELFEDYAKLVLSKRFSYYKNIPYAFSYFDDGKKITDEYRYLYRGNEWLEKLCGSNPFEKSDIFMTLIYSTKTELFNFCNKFRKLYIYGAGKYGLDAESLLGQCGVDISGFVVSDDHFAENQSKALSHTVFPLSQIENREDVGILIALSAVNTQEALRELKKQGINNIYYYA